MIGLSCEVRLCHQLKPPCCSSALPEMSKFIKDHPVIIGVMEELASCRNLPPKKKYKIDEVPGRIDDFVFCTLAPAYIKSCFRFYRHCGPLLIEEVGKKECKKLDKLAVGMLREILMSLC